MPAPRTAFGWASRLWLTRRDRPDERGSAIIQGNSSRSASSTQRNESGVFGEGLQSVLQLNSAGAGFLGSQRNRAESIGR